MKCTLNKADITDVLSKIQGLTSRKSSLAITECVLIEAFDANIKLTATDLETGFEGIFPAVVETPGTIAISARKFFEIVREYPKPEILIQEKENRWINIGDQKVNYHLMAMNPADFPGTPKVSLVDFLEVDSAGFKKMIEKSTIISGIGEDKKPHINGIWFERNITRTPALIRMVSTDGSRLSKYDLTYTGELRAQSETNVLVPKKGLHEVSKFLGVSETIKVGVVQSYFVLQSPSETFYIRLLEGQFPKYEEIVSRPEGYTIQVDKESFLNMLKRMSILCTESYRAAIFRFESNQLVINATNPDIGESKEDMAIDYKGETLEAAFNPRFFIDAVNGIEDHELEMNIISQEKPCLILGAENKDYVSAIMPMRV